MCLWCGRIVFTVEILYTKINISEEADLQTIIQTVSGSNRPESTVSWIKMGMTKLGDRPTDGLHRFSGAKPVVEGQTRLS